MKLKNKNWLTLKDELNEIRNTNVAVLENRWRDVTIDDIKNEIKPYQIVGFAELPDLSSDREEDVTAFVDGFFEKVVRFDMPDSFVGLSQEQQNIAIEALDEATVDAVRKWDSRQKLDIRHKEDRDMKHQVHDWLNSNWDGKNQAEATRNLIDANLVYVKESTLRIWVREYNKDRLNK